jgi:hypothetical protein
MIIMRNMTKIDKNRNLPYERTMDKQRSNTYVQADRQNVMTNAEQTRGRTPSGNQYQRKEGTAAITK